MTRVAVLGALGRMGSLSAAAIEAAEGLELLARIDVSDDLNALVELGVEVVVDFTTPDVVMDNIEWCAAHGISMVVGTSGFDQQRIDRVKELVSDREISVVIVPNFSIGAVVMMKFAAMAAKHFESVEIIEMHHPNKIDAPSGTAIRTAQVIADARAAAGLGTTPDATMDDPHGSRGAKIEGISVHAVRSRGYVASQDVTFGSNGETLSIRHDSTDRISFMPGVVAAVKAASHLHGVHVGLESILDL